LFYQVEALSLRVIDGPRFPAFPPRPD